MAAALYCRLCSEVTAALNWPSHAGSLISVISPAEVVYTGSWDTRYVYMSRRSAVYFLTRYFSISAR